MNTYLITLFPNCSLLVEMGTQPMACIILWLLGWMLRVSAHFAMITIICNQIPLLDSNKIEMFRKGVPWGGTVDYSYPVQPAEIDTIQVAKDQMDLDGYTYFSDSAIPAISIYNKYLTNEEILSRFENQKGLHINADCFTP